MFEQLLKTYGFLLICFKIDFHLFNAQDTIIYQLDCNTSISPNCSIATDLPAKLLISDEQLRKHNEDINFDKNNLYFVFSFQLLLNNNNCLFYELIVVLKDDIGN